MLLRESHSSCKALGAKHFAKSGHGNQAGRRQHGQTIRKCYTPSGDDTDSEIKKWPYRVSPLSVERIKGPVRFGNSNIYVTANKHASFCRCLRRTVRHLWKRNMRKLPIRKWLIQTKKAGAKALGRSSEGKATNPTYWKSGYWETQSDKKTLFWPARALNQPSSAQLLLF